jgi:transcriptional regulator with XRE-family HTH domain
MIGPTATGLHDLGSTVRRLRQARELSVAQLAGILAVPAHTVYNWERGAARVPARYLEPLSQALDLSVSAAEPPIAAPAPGSLARLRLQAHLSQVAAAHRLGISRSSLRSYESGRPLPLAHLRRMAALYDVPIGQLAASGRVRCPRELDLKTWQPGDLGRVLRVLREWSGLTQNELALGIGASKDAVRAWENGRHQPGPALRRELEQLYRLPADSLLTAYCAGVTCAPRQPAGARSG